MSLDKSLKSRGALMRHRNVLSRAERLALLKEDGRWTDEKDVFGLPKVSHRKVTTKKPKATPVEGAEGAEAAAGAEGAPAAGTAAAKPAAAKSAAAPKAGGAKGGKA